MYTHRITPALLAMLSASTALFIVQPVITAQAKLGPYTQGVVDKADSFTQDADRQIDTYGYLSWKYDRPDPYA